MRFRLLICVSLLNCVFPQILQLPRDAHVSPIVCPHCTCLVVVLPALLNARYCLSELSLIGQLQRLYLRRSVALL